MSEVCGIDIKIDFNNLTKYYDGMAYMSQNNNDNITLNMKVIIVK